MRFVRRYDYKKTQYKDMGIICNWFALMHNTITKYGITDKNMYNKRDWLYDAYYFGRYSY